MGMWTFPRVSTPRKLCRNISHPLHTVSKDPQSNKQLLVKHFQQFLTNDTFIHFVLKTTEVEFHFCFGGMHRDRPGTLTLLSGGILTNCSMQAAAKMATTLLGFIKTSSRYSDPNATCSAESKSEHTE